jgi:hypothetical protein
MRINPLLAKAIRTRVARWTFAGLASTLVVSDAVAGDLVQPIHSLWVPATALSLTLVTAVVKSQK